MTVIADAPVAGAPTGREEAWRFTPLARLRGLHESVEGAVGAQVAVVTSPVAAFAYVATDSLPAASGPIEWPAALARAASTQSGVLTIPAGTDSAVPTTVTITGGGADSTVLTHLVIRAERGSRGVVVIKNTGSITLSANIEIEVDDGADLTVISIQDWAGDSVHLGRQHAVLGRDARFRSLVATLGGDVVRIVPTVEYSAPGGDAELLGVFFAEAGQHIEHRLLVDHSQPHCRSSVAYKGALQGEGAHSVWIGDVVIRAEAVGTQTYEINRNLLLTEGARADSVPNLEIETGNVESAGHASTTGRFDDEQLFYLQARGIDPDTARRLVVRGFFADLVARIADDEVAAHIIRSIEEKLGDAPFDEGTG